MSVAIASRMERQSHACATPQRPLCRIPISSRRFLRWPGGGTIAGFHAAIPTIRTRQGAFPRFGRCSREVMRRRVVQPIPAGSDRSLGAHQGLIRSFPVPTMAHREPKEATSGGLNMATVAYLTAEIGLRTDLPTYSGGLGVLAGDHVKAAAVHGGFAQLVVAGHRCRHDR